MRLDPSAEHDLLLRVARGEEKAFKQLVDVYWWPVYYNVLTLTKSAQTAQEFTQDVFLKIWEKRGLLSGVNDLMGYIYVIGKHHVLSAMRKKILETRAEMPEDLVETNNLPEQALDYKETREAILRVIEGMPKRPSGFR